MFPTSIIVSVLILYANCGIGLLRPESGADVLLAAVIKLVGIVENAPPHNGQNQPL